MNGSERVRSWSMTCSRHTYDKQPAIARHTDNRPLEVTKQAIERMRRACISALRDSNPVQRILLDARMPENSYCSESGTARSRHPMAWKIILAYSWGCGLQAQQNPVEMWRSASMIFHE
jgi:hypothetical protein